MATVEHPLSASLERVPSFYDEVTSYIEFGPEDSRRLAAFLPTAEPHFPRISEHFYERIFAHPSAHQAISGGSEQVDRLKRTLVGWMGSGLSGPHDQAFCDKRSRIGHMHVRIGLPQRFMITAMNVMRLDFREIAAGMPDEVALQRSLDRLFDLELAIMLETYKLEAEDRLRRRERLATIGQLAASIGHDLRNPLSVMESSLYILRRRVQTDARATRHLEKIANQIDECDGIITHLLEMARNRPPRRELTSAAELLDAASEAAQIPDRFIVERQGFADLDLWVDAALIKQALVNLLINAVQAQPDPARQGSIQVSASRGELGVTIAIADSGPGFDPETLGLVFEPLVTTKVTGTGLGLALVKSVVERHGGDVSAGNRVEGGAVIKLVLPAAPLTRP